MSSLTRVLVVAAALSVALLASVPIGSQGVLDVTIDEWPVPTANSRPHDPAVAPDGSAWYTGQRSNTLGRLDPATGTIKEYPLPTPNSGPHGLVADAAGNIWYTGNSAAHVGKLDPKTGKVVEYKMPDARARDPHTPIFDQNVRDLAGNPDYQERKEFAEGTRPPGRKIEVTFLDGEVLVGYTLGYDPRRPGFFLFPADPQSNNLRVFAATASVSRVRYL